MATTFKNYKTEVLKDEALSTEYEALTLEYEIIRSLIDIRIQENLTQSELSKKIGIPKANISRFENGKHSPSIQTLMRFAKGLNKKIEIKIVDITP